MLFQGGFGGSDVITIQSVMLVLLGFLAAALFVLLLVPAYWRRAVRLTTRQLRQSMPLTDAEIRADKDRIRAEYAIKVHQLEAQAEKAALASARQQIELNRRDAAISALEGEITTLRRSLEEHENARRVLEQTITDRFPRVEQRLGEARKLLFQRDREISTLTDTTARQARALDEARQNSTQLRDEVLRLNSTMATYAARTREGLADPRFNAEVALRAELESLRSKAREQAETIAALQAVGANGAGPAAGKRPSRAAGGVLDGDVTRLRTELDEAKAALHLAHAETAATQKARAEAEASLAQLRQANEDQGLEIVRLKGSLSAYEAGESKERSISLKDSRVAMRARLGSLQAESERQTETIQRLRGDLAAANERLAKQAAHFMSEMRRMNPRAGSSQAEQRRAGPPPNRYAEPAAQSAPQPAARVSLENRLAAGATANGESGAVASAAQNGAQDDTKVSGFLKALGGVGAAARHAETALTAAAVSATARVVGSDADDVDGSQPDPQSRDRRDRLLKRLNKAASDDGDEPEVAAGPRRSSAGRGED